MTPNTAGTAIYGIAERKFKRDGYIRTQLVAASERYIKDNPHLSEPVTTEFETSVIHWIGSKKDAVLALQNAEFILCYNDIEYARFPADNSNEEDFIAWKVHAAEGEDFEPKDLDAKLVIAR